MKFALKSLAAAAAIVAVGAANAAVVTAGVGEAINVEKNGRTIELKLLGGSGTLTFSNGQEYRDSIAAGTPDPTLIGGLIAALNTGSVDMVGVGGVQVTTTTVEDPFDPSVQLRDGASAKANIISMTGDTETGQILIAGSQGGAQQIAPFVANTLTGGTATVNNLRFDLSRGVVVADLYGVKAAVGTRPAVVYDTKNVDLWTFSSFTGPKAIDPNALLATMPMDVAGQRAAMIGLGFEYDGVENGVDVFLAKNRIEGLSITTAGYTFFANSLGLLKAGQDALKAVNTYAEGYGYVESTLRFTAREVPEPSTYALMGLGLVGISLVARRRRAQ